VRRQVLRQPVALGQQHIRHIVNPRRLDAAGAEQAF